jgi:Bacterial regulatory proteins, gntR family
MPRRPAGEIDRVRNQLRVMLNDGFRHPGQRFVSARFVAQRFKVSYQTAHRLLIELTDVGLISRRAGSGTYIAGDKRSFRRVQLLFASRARRSGSFGELLIGQLTSALRTRAIPCSIHFGAAPPVEPDAYPVIWEIPRLVEELCAERRFCLVLHDRPPPGIGSLFADSVSVDDFGGGISAGQILQRLRPQACAVVAGPANDQRGIQRVNGFKQIFPQAEIISAASWFFRPALTRILPQLNEASFEAIFCASDRLAQATVAAFERLERTPPPMIGFDNAPIAEQLGLSTIGIPWETFAAAALNIIARRLDGWDGTASSTILPAVPILRST